MGLFDVIREVSAQQQLTQPQPTTPGSLNLDAQVRELISQALKHTPLSRYEVAAKMSESLGREITKAQLDSWSAESKETHRFPFAYANAFIEATGDKALLRLVCREASGFFIDGPDALRLELGRLTEQKGELVRRERLVREILEQLGHRDSRTKHGGGKR
jgi:hypothetical protein